MMKITDKGQVTIPIRIRKKMGLLPSTDVEFAVSGKNVIIRKSMRSRRRGARLIQAMCGRATTKMSTDEIMALTRGE
jgi:AbrB family looped-hinge helix DNA binding protein